MDLSDPAVIRRLLKKRGVELTKSLGQNFITDPDVCPRIADSAGLSPSSGVIEIGAGAGVLTVELSKRAGKVVSFEVDGRLLPVLAETLDGCENVALLNSDFMKTDVNALVGETLAGCEEVCFCANLPYYITSPVIMKILESGAPFTRCVFMVQKEAAQRLTAQVGSRLSGAITAAVAYRTQSEYLFDVPKTSFTPPPKVDSAVIRLTRRSEPPVKPADEAYFFRVIRAAFGMRRKTALNSLSAGLGLPKEDIADALAKLSMRPDVRAETFTLGQFSDLSDILFEKSKDTDR